jgi:hypothetical protein
MKTDRYGETNDRIFVNFRCERAEKSGISVLEASRPLPSVTSLVKGESVQTSDEKLTFKILWMNLKSAKRTGRHGTLLSLLTRIHGVMPKHRDNFTFYLSFKVHVQTERI